MKRLMLALTCAACLAVLAVPALANAKTFYVTPTGKDDSYDIQAAFNAAVKAGPGSTVQLSAGQFYTNAIFVRSFNGTFKGAGQGRTFIDTVRGIDQSSAPLGPVTLDSKGNQFVSWPTLFCFAGGNVRVSDMTASITDPAPAQEWNDWGSETTALGVVFQVTGTNGAAFSRITFDTARTGDDGGFNVDTDVQVSGPIHFDENAQPTNLPTVGGNVTISGCSFSGLIGVFVAGLTHGTFTLGGSAAAGNVFSDAYLGLDCSDESASQNVISHNRMDVGGVAIDLLQGAFASDEAGAPVPATPAPRYLITDNDISCGTDGQGVLLYDACPYLGAPSCLAATISGNRFDCGSPDGPAGSVIGEFATHDISCWANSFSGSAYMGLYLGDDQAANGVSWLPVNRWSIVGNDFHNLSTVDASVILGNGTTHCTVVGGRGPTTVLNEGSDNTLVNVTPVTASLVAPALSMRANVGSNLKLGVMRLQLRART